jgi:hypothetical protein
LHSTPWKLSNLEDLDGLTPPASSSSGSPHSAESRTEEAIETEYLAYFQDVANSQPILPDENLNVITQLETTFPCLEGESTLPTPKLETQEELLKQSQEEDESLSTGDDSTTAGSLLSIQTRSSRSTSDISFREKDVLIRDSSKELINRSVTLQPSPFTHRKSLVSVKLSGNEEKLSKAINLFNIKPTSVKQSFQFYLFLNFLGLI